MESKFYKADLHVHTPASDCFEGDTTVNGYWEILNNAVKNNIDIIAITDHNTIAGYETFMNLRKDTQNEYTIIQKYNIPEEDEKKLKDKIELFKKVYIVLGVEITLNPGVHIIVLCPENDKAELNELLDEIGYTSERRGSDKDISPNMDVKTFLSNPKLKGKIVYAPHVDSNKGIWDELSGRYREEIFSANCINAISCNNASQLSQIKKLVALQPGYIRKKPFAYINASDAHHELDVGSKYSFFSLDEFSFESIKRAFEAPEEKISDIERPGFASFVNRCIESNKSVFVEKLEELPKSICAILNNGYGYVILGVTRNKLYSGINIVEKELQNIINDSMSRISIANQRHARISFTILSEKLGNGKCACVISVKDHRHGLWVLDNKETYILEECSFKLGTINDIELLVRENILNELQDFNNRNDTIIKDAMNKMAQASFPISKYILFDKLSAKSILLGYLFNVNPINKNISCNFILDKLENINGHPTGNVYFVTESNPRLDYACLRYSCPTYNCDDEEYISQLQQFKGPAIVISSKGGCHLIDTTDTFYIDALDDALVLTPKETLEKEQISLYHIIAWLKSNFCIWTCLGKTGSTNVYNPDVFNKLFFANNQRFVNNTEIESLVKNILDKEKNFLIDSSKFSLDDYEKYDQFCKDHNNHISAISYRIESIIQESYQIAEEDIDLINNDLKAEKIYTILPSEE